MVLAHQPTLNKVLSFCSLHSVLIYTSFELESDVRVLIYDVHTLPHHHPVKHPPRDLARNAAVLTSWQNFLQGVDGHVSNSIIVSREPHHPSTSCRNNKIVSWPRILVAICLIFPSLPLVHSL